MTKVEPIITFQDFKLHPQIDLAIKAMGFENPTPVQEQAIPIALEGKDVIACAQTGTGKTAAFGIPMMQHLLNHPTERALVVAPTRELAIQITEVMVKLAQQIPDLRPALVIGGLGMRQQKAQMRNNPRIIVATPGRLVDHLQHKVGNLNDTTILVLDEADRMLDMGFAPQLNQILKLLPTKRQTMMFSATLPSNIVALSRKYMKDPVRVSVGEVSRPAEKIDHQIVETFLGGKKEVLLREIKKRQGSVIVFARTKSRTEQLSFYLREKGIQVARIHGDRGQLQRQEALTGFREGTYRVLIATDIACRGLDVPHIGHVINYDLPQAAEDFVHRIGRTARAGAAGQALSILTEEDREKWFEIQRIMNPTAVGVNAPVRPQRDPERRNKFPTPGRAPAKHKQGKVARKFSNRRS